MGIKVAIQGGNASFHDIAVREFFEGKKIEVIPCDSFKKVCEVLESGQANYSIMAIENAIAGSILENYSLIEKYGHFVCGEYKLRIVLNLMAIKGQKIEEIKVAKSHYMALWQCKDFFENHPHIGQLEYHDTADSAKDVKERNLLDTAAIAGKRAAEIYDLEILEESIETIKENYTRFLILSKKKKFLYQKSEVNKATLSFELSDRVGALAETLQIIVENGINLTKIQSVPILGKPDNYTFYIDCTWDGQAAILNCYRQLKKIMSKLIILGEYKNHEIEL